MVRSYLSALAVLALSTVVASAPATNSSRNAIQGPPFTFTAWIEEIGAHPEVAHLTGSQAVAAKDQAVAFGTPFISLKKRAICATNFTNADATDAAELIRYLAMVNVTCSISGGTAQSSTVMARVGNAEIRGSKVNPSGAAQGTPCFQVALTAARIFDNCWQGDGTVKGLDIVDANNQIQVNVLAPYDFGVSIKA